MSRARAVVLAVLAALLDAGHADGLDHCAARPDHSAARFDERMRRARLIGGRHGRGRRVHARRTGVRARLFAPPLLLLSARALLLLTPARLLLIAPVLGGLPRLGWGMAL